MKVRIKFSKQGAMKFIGHLDIMRYFQKAVNRAGIDIKYSEGYSPHQVMSFAAPLGVGLTSNGEYMDIEVNSMTDCETLARQLNGTMAEGVTVLSCHLLEEHAANAMSLVAAADYTVSFRPGHEPEDMDGFFKAIEEFFQQEQILVTKKTKKGEREVDLKSGLYELHTANGMIFMKLSSGSANNLKPELLMETYMHSIGKELKPFACQIQREEMYGNTGSETEPVFVSLAHIGECVG